MISKSKNVNATLYLRSEAIKLPTGQKTESSVNKFPDVCGRNSKNRAPSTGRLPPTPRPMQA